VLFFFLHYFSTMCTHGSHNCVSSDDENITCNARFFPLLIKKIEIEIFKRQFYIYPWLAGWNIWSNKSGGRGNRQIAILKASERSWSSRPFACCTQKLRYTALTDRINATKKRRDAERETLFHFLYNNSAIYAILKFVERNLSNIC